MANANNSNMNIPNTFNLTGTWQNNIDPINNRQNQTQPANPMNIPNNNNQPNVNNSTIQPNQRNSFQEQTNSANQINSRNQPRTQNFSPNATSGQNNSIVNANELTNTPNPINYQNRDAQTLVNFAKTQIGKNTTIEFLIGDNTLVEKTGTIVSVGENYILLNEAGTRNLVACNLNNIKFIYFEY